MGGDRPHVVIVGGGVVGCFIAYYLAKAGLGVTLLERGPVCAEASSAAAGLALVSTRDGFLLDLASRSLELLLATDRELDGAMEVNARGSLTLLRTKEDVCKQRVHVEKQQARGIDVTLLDRQSTLELEPAASPDILGSVHAPGDCSANPFAMTVALATAARRYGALIRTGVEVLALKTAGARVTTAVTREGDVTGDSVVLAAGAWSPTIARSLGLEIPVEPSRGQIMVTEPIPISDRTIKDTGHIYVCPTNRGNSVIGSMTEKVGFNKQLTMEKVREYLREGMALVPALRNARLVRAWAGLRPLSPDNMPLLGEPPGYEGLMLATGHSRLGILLSAATCKVVADLITGGKPEFALEPFSPARFQQRVESRE